MALITKAGGAAAAGDFLGSNLDYYVLTVDADIRLASAGGDANSQARLERVIEIISTRGQPVIMGVPTQTSFTFAIEHTGAWVAGNQSVAGSLAAAIVAGQNAGMGFTNVSCTINATVA